jgi:hypothetical protein
VKLHSRRSVAVAIAALLEIAGLIGLGYAFIPTIEGQPPAVQAQPSKSPSPSVTLPSGRVAVPPVPPKPEVRSKVRFGTTVIPSPPRAVPLCTVTGHEECDVYEDWAVIDGVWDHVVGYHTGGCHTVITSIDGCTGEGTTGGGRDREPPDTLQGCLNASAAAANMRAQAIRAGQSTCVNSLTTFANEQCAGLVTPTRAIDVNESVFIRWSSDFCEQRPRRNARESDDNYDRRVNAWHSGCMNTIAASLTAVDLGRCVDQLRGGSGSYWDKFIIHAGSLGSFGWDVGANHDQGFEAACAQQTTRQLIESNNKKVQDDIECRRRFGGH